MASPWGISSVVILLMVIVMVGRMLAAIPRGETA